MQVLIKRKRQLKITLSAVEICDYFGSFDQIRYDNPKARSVLGNLLLEATKDNSFLEESKRLIIKVFPEERGGCTIYFIASPTPRRLHRVQHDYILEFPCCENMLLTCEQLELHSAGSICSLYRLNNKYRLIIGADHVTKQVLAIGQEYADLVSHSNLEKEKTREHWQMVCQNTPVNKICGL